MPIQRVLLGFDQPALSATVTYLLERYRAGSSVDLQQVIVVLPGRRAGRRLLELLVDRMAELQLLLDPPLIETVGRLPEQLYSPKRPFASELVQRLAWADVLRQAGNEKLAPLVPRPPAAEDTAAWLGLGEMLRLQHVELAADGLDFAQVARHVTQFSAAEHDRWQTMVRLQSAYHLLLDELGLWDRQTARLKAIEWKECHAEHDVVLVGTADMNLAMRHMLDQVASRVTALVFAPQAWQQRFDQHGCLIPDQWQDLSIQVDDRQIELVDGPAEQAEAVLRRIAAAEGRYGADEITIGFPDESLVPDVARILERNDLPSRWGPGRTLSETGPYHLLAAIADHLGRPRFQNFAALVRHPDVQQWLVARGLRPDWLSELDRYHSDHLQHQLTGEWLGQADECAQIREALAAVNQLLEPLRQADRVLSQWNDPLLRVVADVYGDHAFDRSRAEDAITLGACQRLRDAILDTESVPDRLSARTTAAEAIKFALESVAQESIAEVADQATIELLGWLELPLDDAPALIVTSFNEAHVPASVTSDLFLPNALRDRLGLLNNARRYARDAYAFSVLLNSRDSLQLVVARRNRDGDPQAPSRLLFATNAETLARRALDFFQPSAPTQACQPTIAAGSGHPPGPRLEIPRPQPLGEPIDQLTVTSFRDYLACPYRFYLRHVLRLRSLDDQMDELSAAAFGQLAHEVLRRFGQAPQRDSTDADEIRRVLHRELNRCVSKWYGRHVMPVVRVQVEQLRIRLDAFAKSQAAWCARGWRIEFTEVPGRDHADARLEVDGVPIVLRGRIDRIDVHRETKERVVLDYKTSDSAQTPEKTHQRSGQWVDLQLPLYRHLAAALEIEPPSRLGYILLPKDTSRTEFCLANWNDADLAGADQTAREVVRNIRGEQFWPPTEPPPAFSDELAVICQDGVFEKRRAE